MSTRHLILLIAGLAMLSACGRNSHPAHEHHADAHAVAPAAHADDAVCVLQAASGSHVAGTVHFHEQDGVMNITATVSGLNPGVKHAVHIHEFGDLRATNGTSAGGHYNPEGHEHGGPNAKMHHAGDLGNLSADGAGEAHYELHVKGLTTAEILGRSVVVHASEDDLTTQPAGNAGARIAVGVIGHAKPE